MVEAAILADDARARLETCGEICQRHTDGVVLHGPIRATEQTHEVNTATR